MWIFIVHFVLVFILRWDPFVSAQAARRDPPYDPNHFQGKNLIIYCLICLATQILCYGHEKNGEEYAQRCVPDFINVAFNKPVTVTNTCGTTQPTRFDLFVFIN